jgi:hypothetical protein
MDTATRIAIEWDCSQLLLRFYDCFDSFDYDGMAALFTPDGVWHRAGKALQAHSGMVAELSTRSTTQTVRHVVTNLIVQAQDQSHARGSCYLTAYRHDDGQPSAKPPSISSPYLLLVVTAQFARVAQGWRISEQVMKREFEFAGAS